jgi:hypothetical protein
MSDSKVTCCAAGIQSAPPEILLLAAVFEQDSFTVCVQRSATEQNPWPNIHCQFDVSAKRLKHFCHLLHGGPGTDDMNHGFVLDLSSWW